LGWGLVVFGEFVYELRLEADERCTPNRIDNNEFSGLMDDHERFVGQSSPWDYGSEGDGSNSARSDSTKTLSERLYWNGGIVNMGSVGRCVQTVGMAKVKCAPWFGKESYEWNA
jgi:hypothetical protein